MGNKELTKEEARNLITAVVDDEASAEERQAFMDYIEDDDEVRREYESIKRMKSIIRSRCPYAEAPDSLKKYLKDLCREGAPPEEPEVPIYDKPCIGPAAQQQGSKDAGGLSAESTKRWFFAVAASILIIAAVGGFYYFYDSTGENGEIYNLEEYVSEHFQKNEGGLITPNIATANLGSAENRMARDYDMPMIVPELENADFKGIAYIDFVPNFKAPMLEYYLPDEDQYIYIFAFQVDKLEKFGQLVRHQEAVKKCDKPKDFYVRDVKGKHVVSWKWNGVWYAAVSNHSGNRLASLVKPLEYNNNEE